MYSMAFFLSCVKFDDVVWFDNLCSLGRSRIQCGSGTSGSDGDGKFVVKNMLFLAICSSDRKRKNYD